jgi:hypothetical protein
MLAEMDRMENAGQQAQGGQSEACHRFAPRPPDRHRIRCNASVGTALRAFAHPTLAGVS